MNRPEPRARVVAREVWAALNDGQRGAYYAGDLDRFDLAERFGDELLGRDVARELRALCFAWVCAPEVVA